MRILRLKQGAPDWHQHRATRHNASDAPAMLGESPYMTREQLLHRMVTGLSPEVDSATQRRFDDGHAVESLLRPVAEKMLGEQLYAFVGVPDDEDSLLSASYDGCTFVGDTTLECKLLNARLRTAFADMETINPKLREKSAGRCLPIDYRIQLEQQVRVAESERALFMAGELRDDGTLGEVFSCWYYPDDALWARIQGGWAQLEADRTTYVPREAAAVAIAAPIEALPAISARIEGSLVVHSNLEAFGTKLRSYIATIPAKPTTDQEFADCDAACKALKKAEEALDGAEANALGQVQTVETLTRTIADLRTVARTARLASEKMVKARKEQIRVEECQRGRKALDAHLAALTQQIGGPYMPEVTADFGAAISGKKTLDSLRAAVDQLLADKKIEANEIAGRITLNLRTLNAHGDYRFLFNDLKHIVTKQPDDFEATVQNRVTAHQAEEQRRAAAAAEKERERIRREEQEKAEREAREKVQREQEATRAQQAGTVVPGTKDIPRNAPFTPSVTTFEAPVGKPANSPQVVPIARGKPTLRLGDINALIAPLAVTEAGLQKLGFPAATRERSSCLYHEADFDAMCEAIVQHVRTAQERQHEQAAA